MKRRKLKPRKGYEIYLMELYTKSSDHKFEHVGEYIYYWDKKTRRMFEEEGMNVTSLLKYRGITPEPGVEYYEAWARKKPYRSHAQLFRKIDDDVNKLGSLFESYDINWTKVGEL